MPETRDNPSPKPFDSSLSGGWKMLTNMPSPGGKTPWRSPSGAICYFSDGWDPNLHEKDNDPVNHPSHYTSHPSGVECIQVVEHMSFNLGNAVKYIWRAGRKTDFLEDLRKARWYLDREISRCQVSQ